MSNFNIGDRVRYKNVAGKVGSPYNSIKAGLVGTIYRLDGDKYASVKFDKEQPFHDGKTKILYGCKNVCYCENLEYISFKYDPTQAGDTDDDI